MVPASNLIGTEGQGFNIAMNGLNGGRINIGESRVGSEHRAVLSQYHGYARITIRIKMATRFRNVLPCPVLLPCDANSNS